ncbi:hypothetical protein DO72_4506 [Burkholderia pseudomallei]|nr:hypothetical protein DO72_4506 [Burkholderia pseudomallei]
MHIVCPLESVFLGETVNLVRNLCRAKYNDIR